MDHHQHEHPGFEPEPAHDGGSTATATAPRTAPPRVDRLPPWRVLLHNDEVNEMLFVVATIVELTTIGRREAIAKMLEAHLRDLTLLLTTHREHAELLQEQFKSKGLTVTIEAA